MSKKKLPRQLADNEAKAVARLLRSSPRKLNLVAELIRGKDAGPALAELTLSKRRIAGPV
jgi:large subunit ribosomal protein L22